MISALQSQTDKLSLVWQQWPNYKIVKLASYPFFKIWCLCVGKNFWSNVYLTEIWFFRFDRRLSQNKNRRFYAEKKDLYIMGMDLWWEGGSLARLVVEWGVLGHRHRHPPRQAGQGLDQSQSADRIFLCSTFFFSRAAAAAADDGKLNCKKWPLV